MNILIFSLFFLLLRILDFNQLKDVCCKTFAELTDFLVLSFNISIAQISNVHFIFQEVLHNICGNTFLQLTFQVIPENFENSLFSLF